MPNPERFITPCGPDLSVTRPIFIYYFRVAGTGMRTLPGSQASHLENS